MKKGIKTYLVLLCCLLAIKSMALSSHFVICDFDSESNIEMLHSQKIAHDHHEEIDDNDHHGSSCSSSAGEYQYSECESCSDTHISQEVNVSKKRPTTEIDFSFYYSSAEKIEIIASTITSDIIDDSDIKQTAYQPTITVLRI
jgi:hypothetical protein